MIKTTLLLLSFLFCTPAFAGLESETSFDLGLLLAPTFTPETGYDDVKVRFGMECGVAFFKFKDTSLVKVKGVSQPPKTTFKLVRVGAALVDRSPALFFSPISLNMKDKIYVSPSFGFGKDPYTIFSISYELFP